MLNVTEQLMRNTWSSAVQIAKVYETYEYSAFKLIDENRLINQNHVSRIANSMREEALFTPITVNENLEIIDGQHRFYARKELGLPIPFLVCKNYGLNEIQKLNQASKNWSMHDYLESYAKLGYESYVRLKELLSKYPALSLNNAWILSSSKEQNGREIRAFKNGKFEMKDFDTANQLCLELSELISLNSLFMQQTFAKAYDRVRKVPGFDPKKFKDKAQKYPSMLQKAPDGKGYMEQIHKLYNYNNSHKLELRPL